MKNILASALQIGDRVDGSILPELCQHPLAAHQLFTVSYVQKEGAELIHVEFEGRGEAGVFPPLFERNTVISIASSPRDASVEGQQQGTLPLNQCRQCGTIIDLEIPYCSGQCYHDAHFN